MLKFIVIFICPALDEIPFLSKFGQNIKILCLRQNLILRQILMCWISLEIPFLCKFDTDRQVCLITMKLGVYTDSNKELCWNFLFRTGNTSKFDPKGQNCLIKFNVEFDGDVQIFYLDQRLTNLFQKDKIVWLRWNLMTKLIHICSIRW